LGFLFLHNNLCGLGFLLCDFGLSILRFFHTIIWSPWQGEVSVRANSERDRKKVYLQRALTIEILRATLEEEARLKKRDNFFLLISTLFCEVKRGFIDC
jgi:hypothetical protein